MPCPARARAVGSQHPARGLPHRCGLWLFPPPRVPAGPQPHRPPAQWPPVISLGARPSCGFLIRSPQQPPRPCPLPGSQPPQRPLHLATSAFSSAKVSLGSASPSLGCCVQTAVPAPPNPSLSLRPQTQTPDRRAGPCAWHGSQGPWVGGGVRRGFSSLEGRANCAKPAHDWRRVPALGRRGLQHPGPGEGQGEANPSATMGLSSQRRPYCCRSHASLGEVAGPAGPACLPMAGH